MKVLILGGTSFFGKDIARQFFEEGHEIALFTRGNERPTDLPPHHHLKGDRRNPSDLNAAAAHADWDIVIDNIGYDEKDAQMALTAFRRTRRFLFDSTVSVYRYVPEKFAQPLKEESVSFDYIPPEENLTDIHWKYARGKLDAERVFVRQSEVPWTIIRPPVVYGPYDTSLRGFWYLARLLNGGPILLSNGGLSSFRLAYSRDIARAFLLAAREPKAERKTYFIAHREIITLKDFIEESAHALGITPQFINLPAEVVGELAGPHSPMSNLIVDITQAEIDLGFRPTPFSQFVRETALWFRDHWTSKSPELLKTRPQELALAQKWQSLLKQF